VLNFHWGLKLGLKKGVRTYRRVYSISLNNKMITLEFIRNISPSRPYQSQMGSVAFYFICLKLELRKLYDKTLFLFVLGYWFWPKIGRVFYCRNKFWWGIIFSPLFLSLYSIYKLFLESLRIYIILENRTVSSNQRNSKYSFRSSLTLCLSVPISFHCSI
jgi:hypothetical protein